MSLRIDCERIAAILLPDGQWYPTPGGAKFDSFEIVEITDGDITASTQPQHESSGLSWTAGSFRMAVPLSSVVAVRYQQD